MFSMQCFNALGTEIAKPSQAAQCVGYIACAELPRNQWQDLISKLFDLKKISNFDERVDEC